MLFQRHIRHLVFQILPAFMGAGALLLLPLAARAVTVTGYSALLSRLMVSVGADHEIKFVTPTGVEAPSDTMTATYQSDFNLSAIVVADIDFAVDTSVPTNDCGGSFTNKTLAVSPATSPTWGAGISGNILTLTPPTDTAIGEVPANTCVRILIGQNTSFGGVGTHRIVNPSAASPHSVSVAGGFGDTGLAYVLNVSGDQIGVTAAVAAAGGGGGGNGGGNQPSTPSIFNVHTQNLTETEVDVLWSTDVSSSSVVEYGLTTAYGNTVSVAGDTFNHSVHLSSLTSGTTYHYRVRSTGPGALEGISSDFVFTTPDASSPVISNVAAVLVTATSARITWDTDEDADSRVEYGLSASYTDNVTSGALVNSHALDLTGLTPDTTYHYRVVSKDVTNNGAVSGDFIFTTADTIAPVISNIFVDEITQTSALIHWATNELSDSTVNYGFTNVYGSVVTSANTVANHQMALNGLAAGTLYHFSVSSADAAGNEAVSTDQTFTTLTDTVPPANVSLLTVTPGKAQNVLQWTNPNDADFVGVKIQRSTTGYPSTPTSGTTRYDGTGTSLIDAGLVNGTTYYYTVFAYDHSGNFASGAVGDGTPLDEPPPAPVCGNAMCEPSETPASCPADCVVPPSPVCGNGMCEAGEDAAMCPMDCQAPTPQSIDRSSIRLFALSRILELHPDARSEYHILPNRSLTFFVPLTAFPKPVASITLNFGSGTYFFSKTSQSVPEEGYVADVSSPVAPGRSDASIIVTFEDGSTEVVIILVRVEPFGAVTSARDGQQAPLADATVTLQRFVGVWIDWDALPYGQNNSVITGSDGAFAFMAPPGQYRIIVEKEGYRRDEGAPFDVATEVINPSIEAIVLPPSIIEAIVPGAPIVENIANIASALGAQVSYIAKVLNNEIIQDPRVKAATTQILVPTAAVVTTTILVTAVQATSVLNYLYFLTTQPLLLFARRKRKKFGTVYDSLTKLPIDLASIRLFAASTNRPVRTAVTDRNGRYAFFIEKGEYRLEATKAGFAFPSQHLAGRKEDAQYLDLYGGERIVVGDKGAVITANVPLDPLGESKTDHRVLLEEIARRFQNVLAPASVLFTLIAAMLYRQPYLYAIAGGQVLLYALFRRLARPKRPKNWGIIYDEQTKKPISFAIARIVETRYNKILESRVTDSQGRYNFLVGNNRYYVTVDKSGYAPAKTGEIDLAVSTKEGGVVSRDIPMKELLQE